MKGIPVRTGRGLGSAALVAAVMISVTGCRNGTATRDPAPRVSVATTTVAKTPAISNATELQDAFVAVAEAVEPAVVTITTDRTLAPMQRGVGPDGNAGRPNGSTDSLEEFLRRFRSFGPGIGPNSAEPNGAVPHASGLGSGFLYDPSGLILTNAHVVRGADTVAVKLSDGRTFRNVRVIGSDVRTDIAVLKIDAPDLPVLSLGDSSQVSVGEWAIAVGNPFGFEKTLTVGVISATAREVPLSENSPGDYLQTDASINPGNSGGPLVDIRGRVVGMNNAIYSRTGSSVGIGFAIPINTAREVASQLVKDGRVRRARLGVAASDLGADQARAFGVDPSTRGALVQNVEPNSPAARAGVQPGDIVTAVNGTKVEDAGDLQQNVSKARIGSESTLTLNRSGKTITLKAALEELADEANQSSTPSTGPSVTNNSAPAGLGMRLAPISSELADRFRLSRSARGALIAQVENGSPADSAGLRQGDLIERVGQTATDSPQAVQTEVRRALERQKGGDAVTVPLYVNRGGQRRYVFVPVGQ